MFTIIQKNLPPLKHILVLPTWGLAGFILKLELIEKVIFDLGHPVVSQKVGIIGNELLPQSSIVVLKSTDYSLKRNFSKRNKGPSMHRRILEAAAAKIICHSFGFF